MYKSNSGFGLESINKTKFYTSVQLNKIIFPEGLWVGRTVATVLTAQR